MMSTIVELGILFVVLMVLAFLDGNIVRRRYLT